MRRISETGNRGFTLLELLVVLAIIALLAASWPLFESRLFSNQRLRNLAQTIAAAIRTGQLQARLTGSTQTLHVAGGQYSIGEQAHALPRGIVMQVTGSSAAQYPASTLALFPDGSSSGGVVRLSAGDHSVSIRVLPLTGMLEIDT